MILYKYYEIFKKRHNSSSQHFLFRERVALIFFNYKSNPFSREKGFCFQDLFFWEGR